MRFHLLTDPVEHLDLPGVFGPPVHLSLADVRWDQEVVLVADMGEQRSAGYAVRHLDSGPEAGGAVVQLEVQRPRPGAMVAMVITHPTCMVRIPRDWVAGGGSVRVLDQNGLELSRLGVSQP